MKERIIEVCLVVLEKRFTCHSVEPLSFQVIVPGSEPESMSDEYTISIDDFEIEEGDEVTSSKLPESFRGGDINFSVENHVGVLDLCVAAMASDEELFKIVTDFTTDGDGSDCEAIFAIGEDHYILKVR